MAQRLNEQYEQEYSVEEDEGEEVFMVAVSKAIVYERAVVIEKFYAPFAYVAMKAGFTLDHFTVGAKVIQVKSDFQGYFDKLCEVIVRFEVARLSENCVCK